MLLISSLSFFFICYLDIDVFLCNISTARDDLVCANVHVPLRNRSLKPGFQWRSNLLHC